MADDFPLVPGELKGNYRALVASGASTWADVASNAASQGADELARFATAEGRKAAGPPKSRSARPAETA